MRITDSAERSATLGANTEDQELQWVVEAQKGDRVAFNRLVLRWQQPIYNLTLRMLRDPEDASEVTQETFMAAFRHIRRFRLESKFSTWIYRIASNHCLTRLRKQPRKAPRSLDEPGHAGPLSSKLTAGDSQQEKSLLRRERRQWVRRALGGLPPEQRMAIELKVFQDLTFEEISAVTEIPMSTVKSRFYAGLQGLKQRLQACGMGD
ncbi:MAG TPA: sigma-70 family RNA polymerase sigma factor [Acidobacteriota bacterium]|nr:sigma-70 family RNA polymerase sigma factor [Acidobacteriota bacterium]